MWGGVAGGMPRLELVPGAAQSCAKAGEATGLSLRPDTYRLDAREAALAVPLLQTKLMPPRLPPNAVALTRQRIWMNDVLAHGLCLVRAPSGYGKSTFCTNLHNDYQRQGLLTGWVSFSRDDDDASRSMSYLLQAILRPLGGTGSASLPRADGMVAPQSLAAHCINAVHAAGVPLILFLDDFDRLTEMRLLQFVSYLLVHAPANLHVVAACQAQPALPLTFLDAHGQLLRIGIDQLRLSDAEAGELLVETGTLLDCRQVAALNTAMAGWVTGLRIGSAALRNNRDALDDIGIVGHGAHWLGDYLDENIFQHLTLPSRDFLQRCAIVETLTAELAQLLAGGNDAAKMLGWLADQNLFIQRLDEAGLQFRIHPVFREFLLGKLRADPGGQLAALHRSASDWFAGRGLIPEAIRHAAEAGDAGRAAELLAQIAMPMVERSDILGLLNSIAQLPAGEVAQHIVLRLAQAWALTLSLRPGARQLIDALHEQAAGIADAAERDYFAVEVAGLETIYLAVYEDRIDAALTNGTAFLARRIDEDRFVVRAVRNAVAYCELGRGNGRLVYDLVRPAQLGALRREQLFTSAYRATIIGLAHRQQGQLAEAERAFRMGVDLAERLAGRESASAGLVAAFLARSQYERDALDEAAATLAGRLPIIDEACYHEAVISAYMVAIRLAALRGEASEAARLIDHVELLGHERGWRRLLAQCVVERVRLGLPLTTDPESILAAADEVHAVANPLGLDARTFAILAKPRLKLALAAGDGGRARQIADRFTVLARSLGTPEIALAAALLRLLVDPQPGAAELATVSRSIALGFGRSIVDVLSKTHLVHLVGNRPGLDVQSQLSRLSEAIAPVRPVPGSPRRPSVETVFSLLTSREIDVLSGVSRRLSNKEIARQVHLTPETVKWHLKNVMRKLGADNRAAAVLAASRLGLSVFED